MVSIDYSHFLLVASVLIVTTIYAYVMLKLRQSAKEEYMEYICPSCKEKLKLETTLKPFTITYRCANPDCSLSRGKQESRDGEKN